MSDGSRYARIPQLFFDLRKQNAITGREFVVAAAIMLHYNWKSGDCFPAASTITKVTGIHERHVYEAIHALEKAGALVVVPSPGKVSRYRLPQARTKTVRGRSAPKR